MSGHGGASPHPVFDFHARLVPRPGAAERLIEVLDASRIERAVVCAGGVIELMRLSRQLVLGGHVETDADNDALLRAAGASRGRLIPFWFANPHRDASHYRARAAEFRGLEISPAVHGVDLTDPRIAELVAVAGEFGHPVYTVCLERAGSAVADLADLARRFPDVTFVLGHSGVGNIDYYGVEVIAPVANVLLETSGGYTTVLRAAIERLGADRVLFGTEFPLQHPDAELAKYAALDLPAGQWRRIAWDNAVRLLGGSNNHDADHQPAAAAR
ncbi:amidohydrolase family protein [Streptomyces sp. NPDC002888]|uniref:amidohydrolase family protein n=1 Tax=Streptomyces sp. NPDC002888 TaxID=3364668 RepID=UPI00367C8280